MIDCVITLKKMIDKLYQQRVDVQLTRPDPKFGDFATNVALQLAKPLGKNPCEIAEKSCAAARSLARLAWLGQASST